MKGKEKNENNKISFGRGGFICRHAFSACSTPVEKVEFSHGKVEGTVYSNDMVSINADFGEGWTYFSDEDLAAASGITDFSKEQTDKAFTNTGIVYDMYVANADNENVNVLFENLEISNNTSLDEQGYIDASISELKTQLEAQFTVDNLEQTKITFAGTELPCVKISLDVSGVKLYECQTYKKAGQYMCVITVTAKSQENAENILSKFTAA